MNCKNCGSELATGQKFCQNCGSKVEEENVVKTTEPVNNNPISEPGANQNPNPNSLGSSNPINSNNQASNTKGKGEGFKIASLVIGIISLVLCIFNLFMLPLEITGLILAIVYKVKTKKTPAGLILNIIAIVLSIIIFVVGIVFLGLLGSKVIEENKDYDMFNDQEYDYEDQGYGYENPETDKYSYGYKYFGSDDYGYMKVPNNWTKFYDVNGTDTLQYSYGNVWIATLYSTDKISSKYDYAKAIYSELENDGAEDIEMELDFITDDSILAYKVSCYYEDLNVYLKMWTFEDSDGKVYYAAIEGPDETSEYFDLINTFVFEK